MLDLVHVQSFVAVVETGSFHEAARRLGLAQPTVSQHLRKLEEMLQAALVVRSHVRCIATAKGETFLQHARRLLRAAELAQAAVRAPRLVVGAASNIGIYLLPRIVRDIQARLDNTFGLDLSIGSNPVITERLRTGEVDVGLTEWWSGLPGFEARIWRAEPLLVIVPAEHPWANRRAVRAADLVGAPLIGGEPGTGTGRILREMLGAELASQLHVVAELGSTEAVKQSVAAGLGVSIVLAGTVEEEVKAGSLRAVPLRGVALRKPLYIALPEGTPGSAPAMRFRDLLLSAASARPPLSAVTMASS